MTAPDAPRVNVADRLAAAAAARPDRLALVQMGVDGAATRSPYELHGRIIADPPTPDCALVNFGQLNADADTLARGLLAMGIGPGKRIALLVKPSVEFVTLVFALLRTGATMVLVDSGLGRKNIVRCLASTEPDGFVAIPLGHALRVLKRKHFSKAKLNVTVGRRWFWGGETLKSLRKLGERISPSPSGGGARGGGTVSGGVDRGSTDGDRNYLGRSTRDIDLSSANDSVSGESTTVEPGSNAQDTAPPPLAPPPEGEGELVGLPCTVGSDPAAIVFTSGSTGPPKGVLYTHQTFATQCEMIAAEYDIRPGDVDLACFPLFGLFNVACGVTVVLPEMDFSRPASCDPKKLIAAANQWACTQAFASPAVWDRVSRHCEATGDKLPTLKKLLSCGAPVPAKVMKRTLACVDPEATMHTPYGATEALPIATIEAREVFEETAAKTDNGAGVCVGRRFGSGHNSKGSQHFDQEPPTSVGGEPTSFDWRIIQITDDPIATIDEAQELPTGEIGELIVKGPQVSTRYLNSPTHNAASKIADGETIWHRMGDVGYFDEQGRFWYCGRKSQRVVTPSRTYFTERVEQVANTAANVRRTALVGVGPRGDAEPCLVVETATSGAVANDSELTRLIESNEATRGIEQVLPYGSASLPTDIRHNSKIRREELAVWAEKQLSKRRRS